MTVDDAVVRALAIGPDSSAAERTIDITTLGRRSGIPRRIEVWFDSRAHRSALFRKRRLEDHDNLAFAGVAIAVVAGAAGLLVLLYPMILPPDLTIARAASPSSSLDFLLGGFGTFVPLVFAYNAYAFWVLRPRRTASARTTPASAGS